MCVLLSFVIAPAENTHVTAATLTAGVFEAMPADDMAFFDSAGSEEQQHMLALELCDLAMDAPRRHRPRLFTALLRFGASTPHASHRVCYSPLGVCTRDVFDSAQSTTIPTSYSAPLSHRAWLSHLQHGH
jgi:hypothetical protein